MPDNDGSGVSWPEYADTGYQTPVFVDPNSTPYTYSKQPWGGINPWQYDTPSEAELSEPAGVGGGSFWSGAGAFASGVLKGLSSPGYSPIWTGYDARSQGLYLRNQAVYDPRFAGRRIGRIYAPGGGGIGSQLSMALGGNGTLMLLGIGVLVAVFALR